MKTTNRLPSNGKDTVVKSIPLTRLLLLGCALSLWLCANAQAQTSASYDLAWWTHANGGDTRTSANGRIVDSVGQTAGQTSLSASARIEGGFIPGIPAAVPADTGNLTVTLEPAAARDAGAAWSVDSGTTWHVSSDNVTLPVGDYTVSFREITGWIRPAPIGVTVLKDQTTNRTAQYLPPLTRLDLIDHIVARDPLDPAQQPEADQNSDAILDAADILLLTE